MNTAYSTLCNSTTRRLITSSLNIAFQAETCMSWVSLCQFVKLSFPIPYVLRVPAAWLSMSFIHGSFRS